MVQVRKCLKHIDSEFVSGTPRALRIVCRKSVGKIGVCLRQHLFRVDCGVEHSVYVRSGTFRSVAEELVPELDFGAGYEAEKRRG